MSKSALPTLIAAAAVVVLAFVFNPAPDKHRAKIKQAVAERSELQRVFGVGHLTAFASEYRSLGVASYTTINGDVTSVGVLGLVFVLG
jgi:hypothetical protein